MTDTITAVVMALVREPMAAMMALLAAVLIIVALATRGRDRALTITLAILSGLSAWMIATNWRWPWH